MSTVPAKQVCLQRRGKSQAAAELAHAQSVLAAARRSDVTAITFAGLVQS